MKKYLFAVLTIVFVIGVVIFAFSFFKMKKLVPTTPPEKIQEPLSVSFSTNILKSKENDFIVLYLKPTTIPIKISAFDLNVELSANENLQSYKEENLIVNSVLTELGWSFPIQQIKFEEGKVFIQYSGFFIGEGRVFELENEIEIARIPINRIESIIKQKKHDESQTSAYDASAQKIELNVK